MAKDSVAAAKDSASAEDSGPPAPTAAVEAFDSRASSSASSSALRDTNCSGWKSCSPRCVIGTRFALGTRRVTLPSCHRTSTKVRVAVMTAHGRIGVGGAARDAFGESPPGESPPPPVVPVAAPSPGALPPPCRRALRRLEPAPPRA